MTPRVRRSYHLRYFCRIAGIYASTEIPSRDCHAGQNDATMRSERIAIENDTGDVRNTNSSAPGNLATSTIIIYESQTESIHASGNMIAYTRAKSPIWRALVSPRISVIRRVSLRETKSLSWADLITIDANTSETRRMRRI
jgi:hypothetical protein